MARLPKITGADKLEQLVADIGFLPMFRCCVPGFSLEELTPERYWFQEGVTGAWEWREAMAESGRIAYGKLFARKAGFVSLDWYPFFANYRRQGYDFDSRWDDGLATAREKRLMDTLERCGSMLSSNWRRAAGVEKGFEGAVTALQMQTYVAVQRFEYKQDRHGRTYGWGIGRYQAADTLYGPEVTRAAYSEAPQTSMERILAQVRRLFPQAEETQAVRLIR